MTATMLLCDFDIRQRVAQSFVTLRTSRVTSRASRVTSRVACGSVNVFQQPEAAIVC